MEGEMPPKGKGDLDLAREKEVMEYVLNEITINKEDCLIEKIVKTILHRYSLVEKDVEKLSDTIVRDRY